MLLTIGCGEGRRYDQAISVLIDVSGTYADQKTETVKLIKGELLHGLVRVGGLECRHQASIGLLVVDLEPGVSLEHRLRLGHSLRCADHHDARDHHRPKLPGIGW